MVDDMIEL